MNVGIDGPGSLSGFTMNKRSQAMLRDFAPELPAPGNPYDDDSAGPFGMARAMVTHNNENNGAALDYCTDFRQGPDHRWVEIAWVYDTTGMTGDGGDVVMCWWQQDVCPSCQGYGYIELFHPSTDALIGSRDCPETHPGPPPTPVNLVKAHYCDDPYHCSPF